MKFMDSDIDDEQLKLLTIQWWGELQVNKLLE